MTSLIVIHGVGDPSDAELFSATNNIAAGFPGVHQEDRYYVNWNSSAADRVLQEGEFRFGAVVRLFRALWRAIKVGRPLAFTDQTSRNTQRMQGFFLSLNRLCFGFLLVSIILLPSFGLLLVAPSFFSYGPTEVKNITDLANTTTLWLIPATLMWQVVREGIGLSQLIIGNVTLVWAVAAAFLIGIAVALSLLERSTASFRVATRQVCLSFFGPIFVMFLLPVFDSRAPIALIAAALGAPMLIVAYLFLITFVISLPFVGLDETLLLALVSATCKLILIAIVVYALFLIIKMIRPYFANLLKIFLDILLYVGDDSFQLKAHEEVDKAVKAIHKRSSEEHIVIVAHSLGSMIALESLLTSKCWRNVDNVLLVTMGSPIRRFFNRFFPDLFFPDGLDRAAEIVASRITTFRWVNIYRPFDQIGTSLGFDAEGAARDVSTKQWNRFLDAHTSYWSDTDVIALIRDIVRSLTPINPSGNLALDFCRDFHIDGARSNNTTFTRAKFILLLGVFVWIFVSLLIAAAKIDQKLVAEHTFFHTSSQVIKTQVSGKLTGHTELIDGAHVPVTRLSLRFQSDDGNEYFVRPRKLGVFYTREVFDFNKANAAADKICKGSLYPWKQKNCPPLPIEIWYDQSNPDRHLIEQFYLDNVGSFWNVLYKFLVCGFWAFVASALIAANVWIAWLVFLIATGGMHFDVQSEKEKTSN